MTRRQRRNRLQLAQSLAKARATQWRVYREGVTGWRLVTAKDEYAAMKRVRKAVAAKPSLPSSQWKAIYQEVGL